MVFYPEAWKEKPKNFFLQRHLWAVPTLDQYMQWGPFNWSPLVHKGLAAAKAISSRKKHAVQFRLHHLYIAQETFKV